MNRRRFFQTIMGAAVATACPLPEFKAASTTATATAETGLTLEKIIAARKLLGAETGDRLYFVLPRATLMDMGVMDDDGNTLNSQYVESKPIEVGKESFTFEGFGLGSGNPWEYEQLKQTI